MAHTIFFSWQSDRPPKSGRRFVEEALKKAIEGIQSDTTFDEAVRDEGISFDKDTQDVPGAPPIVETILKKIEAAAIFVPDVTYVGVSENNRKIPNPNVLLEYGWALHCMSHARVIPVMNAAYGAEPESLPFDLRHMRAPISYNLPRGADATIRASELKTLVAAFDRAIPPHPYKRRLRVLAIKTFSASPFRRSTTKGRQRTF